MYARVEVPPPLLRLACLQGGVVTREQVFAHGVSRAVLDRLVDSGSWQRISRGLFSTVNAPPTWEALAWGGTLLGGPRSRLGPESSAYLYGLQKQAPLPIDILVPAARPVRVEGPWRFVRENPSIRSGRSRDDPPRLTAECTVLDLAASRPVDQVVGLVTDAVRLRLTTTDRLRAALDDRARHRHRQLLAGLLSDVAEGVDSRLELLYLRSVERPHGLPRGRRQGSRAGLPYRRDVEYPEFGLLVELDGKAGHEGSGRFRDMDRDNRHALLSELTLRYGYYDVSSRPCLVAAQVYRALAGRGYAEAFIRCARCSAVPDGYLWAA